MIHSTTAYGMCVFRLKWDCKRPKMDHIHMRANRVLQRRMCWTTLTDSELKTLPRTLEYFEETTSASTHFPARLACACVRAFVSDT